MSDEAQEAPDLTAVLARLEALEAENAELKAKQPQFRPMERPQQPRRGGYVPPEELQKQAIKRLRSGQATAGRGSIWDDPEQRGTLPPGYRPYFEVGDAVRLNPDAEIYGSGGETWGSKTLRDGTPATELVGEVLGTMGITKSFEPKYKVLVRGLTQANGDGIRERELLPA